MAQSKQDLKLNLYNIQPHFCNASVVLPTYLVDALYNQASLSQKKNIHTYGFQKGTTPLGYIEQNFKSNLLEHLKEFLLKYFVISFLYKELHDQKILIAGEPRITDIMVQPHHPAEFHFELSLAPLIELNQWKEFLFKAPKRKNYKDIDRQVESFIKEELDFMKQTSSDLIGFYDWINFDLALINNQHEYILNHYKQNLWLKIGDEEADIPFQEEFSTKKVGTIFYSNNQCFQEYFSNQFDTHYNFHIVITDHVPHSFFNLEQFKHHFRLKNNKDIQQKLIEIFSYRNDLSQRRAMVEDALHLLLAKHSFEVPNYLILRQQKTVLEAVQNNPDYHVYKTQPDFKNNVRLLAEKQAKETLLIDKIALEEEISLSAQDLKSYLNLTKRARTKEFIYFHPPMTKLKGQEVPLPAELLKQACLREKTLNTIIYHLTRK